MKKLNEMTSVELTQLGKEKHIKNWWKLNKSQLIEALENHEAVKEYRERCDECGKPDFLQEFDSKLLCSDCIEKRVDQQKDDQLPELTDLEFEVMSMIPQNEFYDSGLESVLWTDVFLEDLSESNKVLRGVLSSLKQKNLLCLYSTKESSSGGEYTDSTLSLTDLGKIWMKKFQNGEIKKRS